MNEKILKQIKLKESNTQKYMQLSDDIEENKYEILRLLKMPYGEFVYRESKDTSRNPIEEYYRVSDLIIEKKRDNYELFIMLDVFLNNYKPEELKPIKTILKSLKNHLESDADYKVDIKPSHFNKSNATSIRLLDEGKLLIFDLSNRTVALKETNIRSVSVRPRGEYKGIYIELQGEETRPMY